MIVIWWPLPNCWSMSRYYWSPVLCSSDDPEADIVTHVTLSSPHSSHGSCTARGQPGGGQETAAWTGGVCWPDRSWQSVCLWCAAGEESGLTEWRTDQRLVVCWLSWSSSLHSAGAPLLLSSLHNITTPATDCNQNLKIFLLELHSKYSWIFFIIH